MKEETYDEEDENEDNNDENKDKDKDSSSSSEDDFNSKLIEAIKLVDDEQETYEF